MEKINRPLNLYELTLKKSYFLFGPRGTGKSFLIRENFPKNILIINLLRSEDYFDLNLNPEKLRERIKIGKDKIVVIDEIQKIPQLLNEVHFLIEEYKINFLLTGSSLRKLKSANVNMLGGRARKAELFPLTFLEIKNFNLDKYLRFGGLPGILSSDDPREDLSAYVNQYILEEINLEAKIRKLNFFQKFLELASLYSGEIINYANIASDCGVSEPTVKNYYQILEETLVGFELHPWTKGKTRKSIKSSKFYLFDTGVLHTILRSPDILDRNSDVYGKTFEQFLALELRAYISYKRLNYPLNFWRSIDKHEVDFIINEEIAIEVKSSRKIKNEHFKGLVAISEEKLFKKRILISHDQIEREREGVECLHWKIFLTRMWAGEIF